MEDNIKFQDVGIVSFDTNADTKIVYGLTDSTSINHVVNSSEIRTGIGNVYVGEVYESKSLEVSVTPTLGNFSTMAVQTKSGDAVTNTSIDVPYVITREAIDDGASGAEILLGDFTPVDDEVVVVDKNNELIASTFAVDTITLTAGNVGEVYYVTFKQTEATADVLEIDASEFPEKVKNLTVQTIGYNIETGKKAGDLFIIMDAGLPDGNFTLDLAKASLSNTEVTFKATPKFLGSKLGTIVWVPVPAV